MNFLLVWSTKGLLKNLTSSRLTAAVRCPDSSVTPYNTGCCKVCVCARMCARLSQRVPPTSATQRDKRCWDKHTTFVCFVFCFFLFKCTYLSQLLLVTTETHQSNELRAIQCTTLKKGKCCSPLRMFNTKALLVRFTSPIII